MKTVDKLSGITQILSVAIGVHVKPHLACDAGPAVDKCKMIFMSLGPTQVFLDSECLLQDVPVLHCL